MSKCGCFNCLCLIANIPFLHVMALFISQMSITGTIEVSSSDFYYLVHAFLLLESYTGSTVQLLILLPHTVELAW